MIRVNFHPVVRRERFTASVVPFRRGGRLCLARFLIGIHIRRRSRFVGAAVTGFATRFRIIAVLAQSSPLIFPRVVCVAVTHGQMTNGGGGGRGAGLLLLPRLSGGMICVGAGYSA